MLKIRKNKSILGRMNDMGLIMVFIAVASVVVYFVYTHNEENRNQQVVKLEVKKSNK